MSETRAARLHSALERALPPAATLATGLYAARIACESGPGACRAWQAGAAAVGGLAAATLAVHFLRRAHCAIWPLLLPAVYVLWPSANRELGLAVGVVAAAALLLAQQRLPQLRGGALDVLAGAAFLLLYVGTLAPSVQPADAGEFQLVASVLGIAHPPGYPLYTLLGRAFTLLPMGDPAWRVNLFAAVCAAATVAVVGRSVRRATGSAAAGLVSGLALGLSPTFWAQGTFANVRSLTALLTALSMYALLCYGEAQAPRYLAAFAVSFGLGVTHHSSLALLALPFAAYLVAVDPRLPLQPRRWLRPAVGFAATFAVLLYLPLRSAMGPAFDSPSVRTLGGLIRHVLALDFQGDVLYFLGRPGLASRWGILGDILNLQFGAPLCLGALALGLYAARRRWPWLVLWGGVAAVNAFAAITYRAPQTVEYLLPAYVALACGLGLGLGTVLTAWPGRPVPVVLAGLATWLALSNGLAAYPSYRALHDGTTARGWAVELLRSAPPGALILSNWHQATPLWYLQKVEGLRPDVQVTYVYPEGATPNGQVWARRIGEAVGQRPVVVTNRYAEFTGLPYRLVHLGEAWLVAVGPSRDLPPGLSGTAQRFGERVEFLGVRLGEPEGAPGREVSAEVAWRPAQALDRDYSWFVHLVGPQGIAGQADLTYGVGAVAVGQVVVDRYRFSLRPDTPPGEYRLIAGVYVTFPDGDWERLRTPAGEDAITLGTIHVRPRPESPATAQPLGVTWADGSRLVGVDYDDSVAGQRRVYLHWCRPAGAGDLELGILGDGQPVGQARVGGGQAGYRTVSCDIPPGLRHVALTAAADGQPVSWLGPWHRLGPGPLRLPGRAPGARYLDLGGEMILVGARWRPEAPAAGMPLAAELQFLAQRPLQRDLTISLSLEGQGWRVQHDGTPALGAIPTLKWLAGWRVRDLRRLQLPAEARGPARLGLTVYDAFTLAPVPVGDDRLARLGQGIHATLWAGNVR